MRRYSTGMLALAFAFGGCQPAETPETAGEEVATESAVQAMDDIRTAFIDAYNAADAAGLAALFAEDGKQSPPLSPVLDRAGIEASYAEQFAAAAGLSLGVEQEDVVVSGDMAVGWGNFTLTAEGAEEPTATGRYGVVCRQDAEGDWKIVHHMWNYETPPPALGAEPEVME
jgi:uncharacterized protein (TIGR02246 family)